MRDDDYTPMLQQSPV